MRYEIKPREDKNVTDIHLDWAELNRKEVKLVVQGWLNKFASERRRRPGLLILDDLAIYTPSFVADAIVTAVDKAHKKSDARIPEFAGAQRLLAKPEFSWASPLYAMQATWIRQSEEGHTIPETVMLENEEADIALGGLNYALLNLGEESERFGTAHEYVLSDAQYLTELLTPIETVRMDRIYHRTGTEC